VAIVGCAPSAGVALRQDGRTVDVALAGARETIERDRWDAD
jgi:hypothetical protein